MKIEINFSLFFSFLILISGLSTSLGNIHDQLDVKFKTFNSDHDILESPANSVPKTRRTTEEISSDLESSFDVSDSLDEYHKVRNTCTGIREDGKARNNKKAKLRKVNGLVGNMNYRKQKRTSSESGTPSKYFSFRGAEEHSVDDLDLEGLFDLDYGGRERITEIHKITPKDIYEDEFRPRKYEYAIGATSRDKKYDIHRKEKDDEIVLVITPKNFFADKNGKLSFLPSLALKINKNSRLSTLVKMIRKLISSAYPDINIERIRHLGTQIILNEAPQTVKLSSLKIRNGNEISVTFKKIPKDEKSDNKYYEVQELFGEELPMTPEGKSFLELPDTPAQKNLHYNQGSETKDVLEDKVLISERDDSYNNNFIAEPPMVEIFDSSLPKKDDMNAGDISGELKSDYLGSIQFDHVPFENLESESYDQKNLQGYKFLIGSDEMDNIYEERAVEAEKEASNQNMNDPSSNIELNNCNYKVNFKQITVPASNFTSEIGNSFSKNILVRNVTFKELEPCKLETLITEINKILKSINQNYSIVGLEHIPSKRELLSLSKGKETHHLLDLEIIKGDEFNAFSILNSKPEYGSMKNISDEDDFILVTTDPIEKKLLADKCQLYMTIFVDNTLFYGEEGQPNSEESFNINQNLVKGGKKYLKAVNVCTQSYISIKKVLEKIKSIMKIDPSSKGIFICGDKIVDSLSNLPVSFIESETCVLRYDS
ncbi:uncharacterized protein cubi_00682 [Cryptosporidium ubiquitum]|uniref:Uncharacterized protein n=1 Tax=Cryptosporidium ubiquitum TaxID=857276 RepID=A0A1J4MCB8_9CRYT|nr:uncharacterized protein cubi_00682 [Cryptosporidium ubiquitum]OII71874.1 hypothetical protein cubi_00682 [Cryptosporidium ubiquitum]